MVHSSDAKDLALVPIDDVMRSHVDPLVRARASPPTGAQGSRGLVILLFANRAFSAFLNNILCQMRRTHTHNYVVIALDDHTCPALHAADPSSCTFPYTHKPLLAKSNATAHYRSLEFNRMVMQRPLWVKYLLDAGFETLQVDLDVAWLADPRALLASSRYAAHDLLFQSEGGHGYNAGFYLARPGAGANHVLDRWIADLASRAGTDGFEEQHSLGRSLRRRNGSIPLRFEKLNMTQFPNGKSWYQMMHPKNKSSVFAIHCNWVTRNKKGRLLRDNLWALDVSDERCDPSWDPHAQSCERFCRPVRFCTLGQPCGLESCGVMLATGWHSMALAERGCAQPTPKPRPRIGSHIA